MKSNRKRDSFSERVRRAIEPDNKGSFTESFELIKRIPSDIESFLRNEISIFKRGQEALGLNPVIKIEPFRVEDSELIRSGIFPHLKNPRLRLRRSSHRTPALEIFCGMEVDKVEEAVALSDRLETSDLSDAEIEEATTRIGVLLGYPECCSRAFAREKNILKQVNEWLFVSRRLSNPGAVPWETTPFAVIEYIPCSLECPETVRLVRDVLDMAKRLRLDPKIREHQKTYSHPFIFLLDRQDQKIELIPLEEPSEEFSYRAGLCHGDDPRLKKIARGNRIAIKEGDVTIFKNGKIHYEFHMKAFLWWAGRVFNPEFWQEWLSAVIRMDEHKNMRFDSSLDSEEFRSALRLAEKLKRRIGAFEETGMEFFGFRFTSIEPSKKGHVFLTIQRGEEKVILKIEEADATDRFFIKSGEFGISYVRETPLDSGEKEEAVKRLADFLA